MSDLTSRYPVNAEQFAQFDEQGFIVLPEVLSAQTLREYEPEITSKVFELNTQHLPVEKRATAAQRATLQVMNLCSTATVCASSCSRCGWRNSPLIF